MGCLINTYQQNNRQFSPLFTINNIILCDDTRDSDCDIAAFLYRYLDTFSNIKTDLTSRLELTQE